MDDAKEGSYVRANFETKHANNLRQSNGRRQSTSPTACIIELSPPNGSRYGLPLTSPNLATSSASTASSTALDPPALPPDRQAISSATTNTTNHVANRFPAADHILSVTSTQSSSLGYTLQDCGVDREAMEGIEAFFPIIFDRATTPSSMPSWLESAASMSGPASQPLHLASSASSSLSDSRSGLPLTIVDHGGPLTLFCTVIALLVPQRLYPSQTIISCWHGSARCLRGCGGSCKLHLAILPYWLDLNHCPLLKCHSLSTHQNTALLANLRNSQCH